MDEKSEEKKEKWLNWLALTTILLALGATLSTLKVGSFSSRSILKQTQASNQWAYYQAKAIKGYLYQLQKEKFEGDLKLLGETAPKNVVADFEQKIKSYEAKVKKYDKDKAAIQKEARKFEKERDQAALHSRAFGIAVILLQLSILLSSIAALMKKPTIWVFGLILGAAGIIAFVNGFKLVTTIFIR
jgi:Flp pilus assembly protein TadB